MVVLILLLAVILPIAWLISETQHRRWVSVVLGVSSIVICSAISFEIGKFSLNFQSNTKFTGASRELIDVIVDQLEAGNSAKVLTSLKLLQPTVYENYEDYPRYTEIVDQFVTKLNTEEQQPDDVGQQ